MSVSKTYFLEVSAHVSLKVAAEGSFRGKKIQKLSVVNTFFLKQKQGSATKSTEVFLISFPLI